MDFPILHGRLAAVYAEIDQMDEAYQQVQLLLEKKPDARVDDLIQIIKFRDQERLDWYRGTLVKAGIPE
ncbi:MAG: hypothetical protein OEU92_33150 [Alphaproteobacteria bacterium]|nr:hypothetical protein [Alphaproteobacteria bacterium]